jgi:cell wall-associated NlpC family hydrolase
MDELIIQYARECLGTPFIHQGRQKGKGLDCAGLLVYVLNRLRVPYNDNIGYPRLPYRNLIKDILDAEPSLVAERGKNLFPGAVLLMRIRREPQHVAIWTGDSIIHSYSGSGAVVEHSLSDEWRRRIIGVYRIVRG